MLENEEKILNDAFEKALHHAKALLANDEAQQCDIEDALAVLEKAVEQLRAYQDRNTNVEDTNVIE